MQRVNSADLFVSIYDCFHQYSNSPTYAASQGRLNKPTSYIAGANNKGQWVQVDFGPEKVAKVTKIGTQGRYYHRQWVSKYTVSFSVTGGYFEDQLHKPCDVRRVSLKFQLIVDKEDMI